MKTPLYNDGRWIAESDHNLVIEVVTDGRTTDEAVQIAAETVRAVNAFDDLLAACKFWLGAVQNSMALRLALTGLPEGAGPALVEMLQEAIAQAEDEGAQ